MVRRLQVIPHVEETGEIEQMKIDGTGKVSGSGSNPSNKSDKVTGSSFEDHLKEAISGKAEKPETLGAPMPVAKLHRVASTGNPVATKAVWQVESMLNDLDIYRNSLADESIPNERLQPLNDSLVERKDDLVSLLRVVDDPELRGLISEAASLVVNENSRYYS